MKKITAIIAIFVFVVTAFYVFHKPFAANRETETVTPKSEGEMVLTDETRDRDGRYLKRRRESLAMRERSRLFREQIEQEMDNPEEDRPVQKTDEQRERLLAVKGRTDPVYFELAPVVMDDMWRNEVADKDWTSDVRLVSSEILETVNAEMESIDCRETLCKAQFVTSEESKKEFQKIWMIEGPRSANILGTSKVLSNQQSQTTLYFSREDDYAPFLQMRERMAEMVDSGYVSKSTDSENEVDV